MERNGREGAPALQRADLGMASWLSEVLMGCTSARVGNETSHWAISTDQPGLRRGRYPAVRDEDGRGWEIEQGSAAGNGHLSGRRRVLQQVYP